MSNLVLYRKYRPKTFAEVIGQEHVIQTVTNAIKEGIVSHGYLFCGPHGCGKTTIARLVAKSLNCQQRKDGQFEPCNECDSCLEVNQGSAIDLIEIDAASNRGIDEIRDLKEGIRFKPAKSKYKIFIIDESHQLTKEAANALLKTLEEPPPHAIFILATTEAHKIIPTIQSRCQRFDFRKMTIPELSARLESILNQEGIAFEKEAISLIAGSASGSVRDAETLLDEVVSFSGKNNKIEAKTIQALLGIADKAAVFQFLDFLKQQQTKEAIEFINELIFKGVDLKEFIKAVVAYIREAMLLKLNPASKSQLLLTFSQEEKAKLEQFAENLQITELKKILEYLTEAENKMKYATILQLPLELAIIDICTKNQ